MFKIRSQPGFIPSFEKLSYLAILKSCDTTKQSVCGWLWERERERERVIYSHIYILMRINICKCVCLCAGIHMYIGHSISYLYIYIYIHLYISQACDSTIYIYIYVCVCVCVCVCVLRENPKRNGLSGLWLQNKRVRTPVVQLRSHSDKYSWEMYDPSCYPAIG